jgi:hypothetical protein
MRGRWTRRLRDLIAAYTSDAGGTDNISEGLRSIIHRVASLQTQMERIEFNGQSMMARPHRQASNCISEPRTASGD